MVAKSKKKVLALVAFHCFRLTNLNSYFLIKYLQSFFMLLLFYYEEFYLHSIIKSIIFVALVTNIIFLQS